MAGVQLTTAAVALAAVVGHRPVSITWISAGDRAGEAVMLGAPDTDDRQLHVTLGPASPSPDGGAAAVPLAVLQAGNGTITAALPAEPEFRLGQWELAVCDRATAACAVPLPLYGPELLWSGCDGAVCAPGGVLRLFGRRLAFDPDGCRAYGSAVPTAGAELAVHLTPRSGPGPAVRLLATRQSCFEAELAVPSSVAPGAYGVALSNVVGGQRGAPVVPAQPDVATLVLDPAPRPPGTRVFRPPGGAMTGDAILAALSDAAASNGGGTVQLLPGVYRLAASATLVVSEGVTLRGAGATATTLLFGRQTPSTAFARRHLGLIHGANTSGFWGLEDLAVVAPQSDHLSQYTGSPVVSDCGGDGEFRDGNWQPPVEGDGLFADSWACSGMRVRRVKITVDKACAAGASWPADSNYSSSCGGYTAIDPGLNGKDMFAGIVPAVTITGRDAVLEDCEITHYGTCGANVAPLLSVNSARNVVVRRNTLRYGCAAYSFGSVTEMVFEHNVLVPYKNASGGGSNIDIFGRRMEMSRLFFANNSQRLCPAPGQYHPPGHLETMTLDGGAGFYEGSVFATEGGAEIVADAPAGHQPLGGHRADWRFAAVVLLAGPGAGQWRRAELQGTSNSTWRLDYGFDPDHQPVRGQTFATITKVQAQLLFVGNEWSCSHFQLYGACFDCVVAENAFDASFAASWGRNPHRLLGGWQPNFQVEWLSNTITGGTGITLLTSDQPTVGSGGGGVPIINASFTGPLNSRIVLRANSFQSGSGVELGTASISGSAQTSGNVLVDSNILKATCNITLGPMPAGADINRWLPCGRNCSLRNIVLHGNELDGVRSC